MMKKFAQFSLVFGIPLAAMSLGSTSAQAFTVAPAWDFEFEEEITGSGRITLDLDNKTDDGFLVEELNFTIDFGDGSGPRTIVLDSFLTSNFRFNPDDTDMELTSSNGTQEGWNLGVLGTGVFNLNGQPGKNFPFDDPANVGGVIVFDQFATPEIPDKTGVWKAKPVPEPGTVLGSTLALGLGYVLRRKGHSKFPRNPR